jgi:hypothetical protein
MHAIKNLFASISAPFCSCILSSLKAFCIIPWISNSYKSRKEVINIYNTGNQSILYISYGQRGPAVSDDQP